MAIPDDFDPDHPAPILDMQVGLVADLVIHHNRSMTSTELHHVTGIPLTTLSNPYFYLRLEHRHGITRKRGTNKRGRRSRHVAAVFSPTTEGAVQ